VPTVVPSGGEPTRSSPLAVASIAAAAVLASAGRRCQVAVGRHASAVGAGRS
jgi:hypothetical protein